MRATFWALAAIIAANTGLTNAVNIGGDASTDIDSENMNFGESDIFDPTEAPKKPTPQAPGKATPKPNAPPKPKPGPKANANKKPTAQKQGTQ